MYTLHYDYMKKNYFENIKLCYMDTESFIYDVKTSDMYDDIRNCIQKKIFIMSP